jgi:hypothetical protein
MTDLSEQPATPPQPPRDARALARLLIGRFSERAESYAVLQALKALARNDRREAARWRWIAEITRETLRLDPL